MTNCGSCGSEMSPDRHQIKRIALGKKVYCSRRCWINGKHEQIPIPSRLERLTDKNGPIPPDKPHLGPCWIWRGAVNNKGYGVMTIRRDRKPMLRPAHCVWYETEIGPVPAGLELDHLCRNPICCRPSHLEAITHRENMRRSKTPFGDNANKTICINGHPFTPENTMTDPNGGRKCRKCDYLRQERKRRSKSIPEQTNKNGYRGVKFIKNTELPWEAITMKNGKLISLGRFHSAAEAGDAYKRFKESSRTPERVVAE